MRRERCNRGSDGFPLHIMTSVNNRGRGRGRFTTTRGEGADRQCGGSGRVRIRVEWNSQREGGEVAREKWKRHSAEGEHRKSHNPDSISA